MLFRSNERSRWVFGVGILILAGLPPVVCAVIGRFGALRFGIVRSFGVLVLAQATAAGVALTVFPADGLVPIIGLGIVGAAVGCASVVRAESLPILGGTLAGPC